MKKQQQHTLLLYIPFEGILPRGASICKELLEIYSLEK